MENVYVDFLVTREMNVVDTATTQRENSFKTALCGAVFC